ncbi:MAG: tetraacyldisaccharide 4'-kinase [Verrucomicrobiota bacterium]
MPNKPLEHLEQFAIDVILERRYGKRAFVLRVFLYVLSLVYGLIVRLRIWLYDNRLLRWNSVGCRVISIGNLTVGGTGKTPVVERFARTLTEAGRKVAILSRGYKSAPKPIWQRIWHRLTFQTDSIPPRIVSDGQTLFLDSQMAGDEPFMLASNLRGVVVLVDKDRVKSALYAIEKFGVDTLLLDDGYQYLPLKERLNVALVDRQAPFGNRYLLPRGTLREPYDHLKRADVVFVTKCNGNPIPELRDEIRKYNKHARIYECAHKPLYLQSMHDNTREPLSFLIDKPVGAVAGIAVPESFEEGLANLGAKVIYRRFYADHHRFTDQEIINALNRTRKRGGHCLITTEKDAVRFPRVSFRDLPVYYLRVEISLLNSEDSLVDCIRKVCGLETIEDHHGSACVY